MDALTLVPIGGVVGGRTEPRDDEWEHETAAIVLDDARFAADALAGLDQLVMREFLPRGEVRQPSWAGELMRGYWS